MGDLIYLAALFLMLYVATKLRLGFFGALVLFLSLHSIAGALYRSFYWL